MAVRDGRLVINGNLLPEGYPVAPGLLDIEPGTLQPDRYALLGDNRNPVSGQNLHAVVARDQVLGQVVGSLNVGGRTTTAAPRGAEGVERPEEVDEPRRTAQPPGT